MSRSARSHKPTCRNGSRVLERFSVECAGHCKKREIHLEGTRCWENLVIIETLNHTVGRSSSNWRTWPILAKWMFFFNTSFIPEKRKVNKSKSYVRLYRCNLGNKFCIVWKSLKQLLENELNNTMNLYWTCYKNEITVSLE